MGGGGVHILICYVQGQLNKGEADKQACATDMDNEGESSKENETERGGQAYR